jgi:hypothetical protein
MGNLGGQMNLGMGLTDPSQTSHAASQAMQFGINQGGAQPQTTGSNLPGSWGAGGQLNNFGAQQAAQRPGLGGWQNTNKVMI